MRVAPEVLQDLGGPTEGPLRIHDPGRLPQVREPGRKGGRLGERREGPGEAELAFNEGALERVQVLRSEDRGEGADGKEEAGRRGDPARARIEIRSTASAV